MSADLWSDNKEGKGVRWKTWAKLCGSKKEGALGFRRVHDFSVALLCRQGWRILTEPNSLMARLLKFK